MSQEKNLGRDRGAWAYDVLALAGAGLVSWGAWQICEPAGFMVAGTLLMGIAVAGARRA
ncbi:hypothetical protein [Xanthobacter sediminis]